MNPKDLFLTALDKPAADRAVFLAGIDPALRPRVEELLSAHEASGEVLGVGPDRAETQSLVAGVHAQPDETQTQEDSGPRHAGGPGMGSSQRLGPYELLEVLGQGGFGTVYRAFDHKLHRMVALKTLAPELAAQGTARQRFLREARAAAAVRHEHVIGIYAVDEQPVPHLVMEFISGQNLQQKLDRQGPLGLKEVLRIGSQIAAGLAAAHAQGLIHRDIKPSNILLENGIERVKISDFGLARAVDDSSISQSGIIAGTPQYMSPEQAEGKTLDARSDLFSLGGTLYACATGRPPFRASSTLAVLKKVVEEEPRPLRSLNPDLPDWLADIIAKLMAKSPAARFQSAKEVADLLQQHLAHEQQPGVVPRPAAFTELIRGDPSTAEDTGTLVPVKPRSRVVLAAVAGAVTGLGGVLLGTASLSGEPWQWPLGITGAGLALAGILALAFIGLVRGGTGWRRKLQLGIIGLGLFFVFVLLERNGTTNFSSRLLWTFHHELSVQLPDDSYTVEFWPTIDPPERQRGYSVTRGSWPFGPTATIVNCAERTLRLAPGNYWAFVRQGGKLVDQRYVTVPWGGQRVLELGKVDRPDGVKIPMGAGEPEPPGQVDLAHQAWELAKKREAAGLVAPSATLEAEAVWLEAKIEQAEKARQLDQVVADLKRLVEVRDKLLGLARAQVDAGRHPPDLHLAAAMALSKSTERLKQAEAKLQPGPWQPLFDGKTLEGWRSLNGAGAGWHARNGQLMASGEAILVSQRKFTHFQMRGEVLLKPHTEFGVLFRSNPSDRALREGFVHPGLLAFATKERDNIGQLKTSCELGVDGKPLARTEGLPPADQWHSFEIRAQGERLTAKVRLNGEVGLGGPDDLKAAVMEGPIILRAGGTGPVEIRNLEIRELPAPPPSSGQKVPPPAEVPQPTLAPTVPTSTVPQPPPKLTEFETKLLAAINRERAIIKAPPLVPEPRLMRAARAQADDMARWEDITHVREGRDPPTRLREVGYPFTELAEVIGFDQRDPEECLRTWLASKGHRDGLLSPRLSQIGIGTGRDAKGKLWHAVILATPAGARTP